MSAYCMPGTVLSPRATARAESRQESLVPSWSWSCAVALPLSPKPLYLCSIDEDPAVLDLPLRVISSGQIDPSHRAQSH